MDKGERRGVCNQEGSQTESRENRDEDERDPLE